MTLLLVGCVLAVYAIASPPLTQQVRQNVSQGNAWEYAQLVVVSEDEYKWLIGGDAPVRVRSTRALLGDLGGNGRPTLANLLNQIGSNRWEIVEMNETTWLFKRQR